MFHHKNHHKENNLSELCSQIICEKIGFKKNSKVHELVTELKSSVNTLHDKFQHHLYQPKDVKTSGKRKLLTPDPLTVALVHSTKLNQIAFVLRDVLWVVSLELNRNLRVKNSCSAAIQKMISLASHQKIAQVLQTTWM
jgi:ribosomal protein S13